MAAEEGEGAQTPVGGVSWASCGPHRERHLVPQEAWVACLQERSMAALAGSGHRVHQGAVVVAVEASLLGTLAAGAAQAVERLELS